MSRPDFVSEGMATDAMRFLGQTVIDDHMSLRLVVAVSDRDA
jgi:hypothetical protein